MSSRGCGLKNVILLTLLILAACGPSPLLHHKEADDAGSVVVESGGFARGLKVTTHFEQGPQVRGESILLLTFTDGSGSLQDVPDLAVEPWMDSMGHGQGAPVLIERLAIGTYRASHLYFIMGGVWSLRLTSQGQPLGIVKVTL